MVEVKFTEQAITDLDDIAEYITRDSSFYAGMQVHKLILKTDILEQFPKVGRIVPELRNKFIRELIEGNYRIVYRIVNKNLVHILTFHHSRKKFKSSTIRKLIKKNK
ncbi:MAG TPA: type II toxin-antitoxin system RelE/ParE family toxin [Chitinophagaceae bacterium]|nr:type II toxin-antitoxin system RelE/ParE family toxin [Chitinophagaceae bacterium]